MMSDEKRIGGKRRVICALVSHYGDNIQNRIRANQTKVKAQERIYICTDYISIRTGRDARQHKYQGGQQPIDMSAGHRQPVGEDKGARILMEEG